MPVRKRAKGTKYQKVTKQQKYIFLNYVIAEQKSIQEAAFHAGIHYSTAKTILFFHKRHYKNYTSYNVNSPQQNQALLKAPRATYLPIHIELDTDQQCYQKIQVISRFISTSSQPRRSKHGRKLSEQVKDECVSREDMVKIQHQWEEDDLRNPRRMPQIYGPLKLLKEEKESQVKQ